MTRQEIEALIDKKIAGQGTAIDAGSVFPSVLKGIISNSAETSEVDDFEEFSTSTAYSAEDIVRKEGKLYKFTASKDAGAWDSTKVTQTNVLSLADKIFVATYGTTTYAELLAAYNTGKVLVCFYGTSLYVLSLVKIDGTAAQNYFRFGRVLAQGVFSARGLNCSGLNNWTSKEYLKGVTSVTASSTNDEIPTAKAVYDYVQQVNQLKEIASSIGTAINELELNGTINFYDLPAETEIQDVDIEHFIYCLQLGITNLKIPFDSDFITSYYIASNVGFFGEDESTTYAGIIACNNAATEKRFKYNLIISEDPIESGFTLTRVQ